MGTIANINGVAIASVSAIDGKAKASIASIGGQTIPASGPVLVQQAVATVAAGNGGADATFGATFTVGNSLVACISLLSTDSVVSVEARNDSGATFTQGPTATVAGIKVEIWYLHAGFSADDLQVLAITTNATRASIAAQEWNGLSDAVPGDTDSNTGLASTTVTTNSVTPATTRNLVIAMGGWTANNYSSGPINSFTRLTETGGGAAYQEAAYKIQSTATAADTGWTLTVGINWAAVIAAFSAP